MLALLANSIYKLIMNQALYGGKMGTIKSLVQKRGFRSLLMAQFFGAYIDNAYRMLISILLVGLAGGEAKAGTYLSAASGLFIIPFILFSPYAGVVADRFSKRTVLIVTKMVEVVVMILGLIGFITMNIWFILFCLFCMGMQSAFYSPAKYGILPEMLSEEDLSRANGLIEMSTFSAIILGAGSAGIFLFLFYDSIYLASFIFILIGVVGVAISYNIDAVDPAYPNRTFEFNFFNKIIHDVRGIIQDRLLSLAVFSIVYFWFMGAIVHMITILYGKELMGMNDSQISFLCLFLALGIGTGSLLAGKLSRDRIELGLVPIGSIGIGIFMFDLFFAHPSILRTGIDFILLGLSGGLFMVPLNAFVQQRSPKGAKGQTIAAVNVLVFTGVLSASLLLYLLNVAGNLSPDEIFLVLVILALGASFVLLKTFPLPTLRFLINLLINTHYRIDVLGEKNIPSHGPAILICNHISYIDPLLLGVCVPRLVHFIMLRKFYELKGLSWFFKIFQAIPVSEDQGPKELLRSLKQAQEKLKEGHLVCIFAEGAISRTGSLLPFKKGVERISRNSQAPIIPVHLDNVWGSTFSFKKKKFFFKLPENIFRPVTISFGKLLPSDTPAYEVRMAVQELGAINFFRRKHLNASLSSRFIKTSKRHWFKLCMADSSEKFLSYGKVLVNSLILARLIKRKVAGDKVGVLLPSSTAAAMVNIAIMLAGKISVNLNDSISEESFASLLHDHEIACLLTSRPFLKTIKYCNTPKMLFPEDWLKNISRLKIIKEYSKTFFLPACFLEKKLSLSHSSQKIATIIFSPGDSGIPRGIILSHQNILSNIAGIQQIFHLNSQDCMIGCLQFSHSLGFIKTIWLPLLGKFKVAYHSKSLDSKEIGDLVRSRKATLMVAAPDFYRDCLRNGSQEQWPNMRYAAVGDEKFSREIFNTFAKKFGITLLEGYGRTELSPLVSVNVPDFNDHQIKQIGIKVGSVGHPLPGIAVKVVNPDTYLRVSPQEEGLILVKGANVMTGYSGQGKDTKKAIRDGWHVTGDIGRVDEDGFVWLADR